MGVRLHLGKETDSGYGTHNSTSGDHPSTEAGHTVLIIGAAVVICVMIMWIACCIILYKKKKSHVLQNVSQSLKERLKICRNRNPSGNSVAYFNHGSPYDEMVIPMNDTEDIVGGGDPALQKLPT